MPVASPSIPRLVTIPISHFCEKARWALDRAGIAYREERHVQIVHRIAARRAGGALTVPVLVLGDGRVLDGSAEIVEHAMGPAAPDVAAFSRELDEGLGPDGRRLMYDGISGDRAVVSRYNGTGLPTWERRLFEALLPLGNAAISRVLDINPATVAASRADCARTLDAVAARLDDGRPFLFGAQFTIADLTFAALAAPLVCPPQYGVPLPQPEELPEPYASQVRSYREHPAGAFALRMYTTERRGDGDAQTM